MSSGASSARAPPTAAGLRKRSYESPRPACLFDLWPATMRPRAARRSIHRLSSLPYHKEASAGRGWLVLHAGPAIGFAHCHSALQPVLVTSTYTAVDFNSDNPGWGGLHDWARV